MNTANSKNLGWFVAAFALVLGPLVAAAPSWDWFTTTAGAGAALLAVAGVLGAAFGIQLGPKYPTDPNVN